MIYKDNASCIVLTKSEGTKPCPKHIALTWHHFSDQIKNCHIKNIEVYTNFNWANLLTKPLTHQKHKALRKMNMGW